MSTMFMSTIFVFLRKKKSYKLGRNMKMRIFCMIANETTIQTEVQMKLMLKIMFLLYSVMLEPITSRLYGMGFFSLLKTVRLLAYIHFI